MGTEPFPIRPHVFFPIGQSTPFHSANLFWCLFLPSPISPPFIYKRFTHHHAWYQRLAYQLQINCCSTPNSPVIFIIRRRWRPCFLRLALVGNKENDVVSKRYRNPIILISKVACFHCVRRVLCIDTSMWKEISSSGGLIERCTWSRWNHFHVSSAKSVRRWWQRVCVGVCYVS